MLRVLRVPLGWKEIFGRTAREMAADNCLNLAAQLAYYFFLALFPALLFLVAVVSFIPVAGLLEAITGTLARVAPSEVISIVQDQILKVAHEKNGGLLTLGLVGTIWSTSSGVNAIIDVLNQAYDVQESRRWWRVKLLALALTIALAVFIGVSFGLVLVGPTAAEHLAARLHLGGPFEWTWKIVQWPVVFALVSLAVALIYYYAPDVHQEWIWITPGSVLATILWLLISLAFKFYVAHFTSYTATYGAIGGVIVLMLWFYLSGLAVLLGAELNAEIEHASPYGKDPGERVADEKKRTAGTAGTPGTVAISPSNCDVDADLPPATAPRQPRLSDWIIVGLVLAETSVVVYLKLRSRLGRLKHLVGDGDATHISRITRRSSRRSTESAA